MRRNSLHGKREAPETSASDGDAERSGKVSDHTPDVHVSGESDDRVVPEKLPNKGGPTPLAEEVEERRSTKGNTVGTATLRTQSRVGVWIALNRVREVARRDRRVRFTALMHHLTLALLRDSFFALRRDAAPGVDEMTWHAYEEDHMERLTDLHVRVHTGTYRAQPSKRTYIPKSDGRQRPLGITSLEDKIVQHAAVTVLNQIYEVDFLGFSYGFRPGRGQHDALDALHVGLMGKKVNWVLDADIQGFFDAIDLGWLDKFLQHRIADRRMLRLIRKWLRAGVSEDGMWSKADEGTPQGAVASPLLANVFLHYAFDLWVHQWRGRHASGDVIVVRYADDFVVGFQHRHTADRFRRELADRLNRFGLTLHPGKTRLLEFGRFASENRRKRGQGKPESFDFLGFTHICGTKFWSKGFIVRRQTIAKKLRAKLQELKHTLMRRRHESIPEIGKWLRSVVRGYYNYHAIPGNIDALETLHREVARAWLHALRRRSQRHRMPWSRFTKIASRWIPKPKILHPYPNVRFYANTQGRSRMR